MKGKMTVLVLAIVSVLGFYGVAMGEGGGPDPGACAFDPWPQPTSGPFLWGEFSIALDKVALGEYNAHYNIHVKLARFGKMHLYSFPEGPPSGINICNYTAGDIKNLYKKIPCALGVEGDFGLTGVPVIAELVITNRDFCDGPPPPIPGWKWPNVPEDGMISGLIVIRVVPTPPH